MDADIDAVSGGRVTLCGRYTRNVRCMPFKARTNTATCKLCLSRVNASIENLHAFVQGRCQRRGLSFITAVPTNGWRRMEVRGGEYCVGDKFYRPTLVFSNIAALFPGKGLFTTLVRTLHKTHPTLNLVVEYTHKRFRTHLIRQGWEEIYNYRSYTLILPCKNGKNK